MRVALVLAACALSGCVHVGVTEQVGDETVYRVTYELDHDPNDLVVTFRDVWVVDEKPENPDPDGPNPADHPRLITLTTCAELFNTDERMIVFGHLVDSAPRTVAP